MKAAVGVGIAVSALSAVSPAAAADITSFLFDVNGSSSASFTTGSSSSASFGPTIGASSNHADSSTSYLDLSASSGVSASGSLNSTIGGGYSPTPNTLTFSAVANGTWTGRFVNVLPTAQSFALEVGGLNDNSGGGIPGDYAAHVFVGAKNYDLSQLYGGSDMVGLGVLAPGQSIDLKMTTHVSGSFALGPTSDGAGAVISSLSMLSYTATPVAAVPEPETYALFVIGLAGLALRRARARRRSGALTRQVHPLSKLLPPRPDCARHSFSASWVVHHPIFRLIGRFTGEPAVALEKSHLAETAKFRHRLIGMLRRDLRNLAAVSRQTPTTWIRCKQLD